MPRRFVSRPSNPDEVSGGKPEELSSRRAFSKFFSEEFLMSATSKAFRISKLEQHHVSSLNQLSSTPQSLASHASALGISAVEASHRLQLLVDEGLAVQALDGHGKPLGTYTAV
jgi:biotin operon repressor